MKATMLLLALTPILHDGITYAPDSNNETFECGEKEAAALIDSGAAKQCDDAMLNLLLAAKQSNDDPLIKKTIEELKTLAQERNVVIPEGVKLKADIVAFLNSDEGQGEA